MELIKWDKLKYQIETCQDITELSKLSPALEAVQQWAKQSQQSKETQDAIGAYRIDLERKRGQWVKENIPEEGAKGIGVRPKTATLSSVGILHHESANLRALADIPDEVIEKFKTDTQASKKEELTLKGAVRLAKKLKREKARAENAVIVETSVCEKPKLAHYQTIVVDPPWDISEIGDNEPFARSEPTYKSMSIKEIIDEHTEQYAATNCHLYLWVINRMIFLPEQIIKAWGFRYVTMLTWCKPSIGMGNYYRNNTEHIMFCIKGKLPLLRNDIGTHFNAARGHRGHSSKPDEFYNLIETCSPGPRLDYFARDERNGWDTFGKEL